MILLQIDIIIISSTFLFKNDCLDSIDRVIRKEFNTVHKNDWIWMVISIYLHLSMYFSFRWGQKVRES